MPARLARLMISSQTFMQAAVVLKLSKGFRAPIEQLFRATIKLALYNDVPPRLTPSPVTPKIGVKRVLPPYLGEMGYEVRAHLARTEPWLRNGWKILARRPEFYPPGTTVDCPEFFEACDRILAENGVVGSFAGIYLIPSEFGELTLAPRFENQKGDFRLGLSDIKKVSRQAVTEIALRQLFMEWLDHEGRPITDYDRSVLAFSTATVGEWEYHLAESLRPSYLPAAFETPIEPRPPHIGFQMRAVKDGVVQPRNSDPEWMCATAKAIGGRLGLPVVAYGHLNGCVIPDSFETTWRPDKGATGHLARELGYLRSCRLMLAPDSGWTDLMAWLGVPVLLEMLVNPAVFEGLRDTFQPRIALVDRSADLGAQVDRLLAAKYLMPPPDPRKAGLGKAHFPWDP